MITIYHNTRCSKSRNALQLLEEHHIPHEVRLYLQQPFSEAELAGLLQKLEIKPSDLLRKGEAIYKELSATPRTEEEWLEMLLQYPQLIERPVAVAGDKAVIARPPEKILELFAH